MLVIFWVYMRLTKYICLILKQSFGPFWISIVHSIALEALARVLNIIFQLRTFSCRYRGLNWEHAKHVLLSLSYSLTFPSRSYRMQWCHLQAKIPQVSLTHHISSGAPNICSIANVFDQLEEGFVFNRKRMSKGQSRNHLGC